MIHYLLAFDLDTKGMDDECVSKSEQTKIYQTEIPQVLHEAGFVEHIQQSVYMTGKDQDMAGITLHDMERRLLTAAIRAPRFYEYCKHMHIFRVEEWCDVADVSAAGLSATSERKSS